MKEKITKKKEENEYYARKMKKQKKKLKGKKHGPNKFYRLHPYIHV